MRKVISQDKAHFYTYSKESLSGAFPVVNVNEVKLKAKLDSEARWRTKKGFDFLGKKTNWNEHPKKPDTSTMDALLFPHVKQAERTKNMLSKKDYNPQDDGKPVFLSRVASQHQTFSKPGYFNTVFISGDDMEKEMAQAKKREQEIEDSKIIVANKHFAVNTRVPESSQTIKYRGMLQDPPNRIGLQLRKKRL